MDLNIFKSMETIKITQKSMETRNVSYQFTPTNTYGIGFEKRIT